MFSPSVLPTGFSMIRRFSPLLVFLAVCLIGGIITATVHSNERASATARFELIANDAADSLQNRIEQHIALLVASAAHMIADPNAKRRSDFSAFVNHLGLAGRYEGIQGIGYSEILSGEGEAYARARLKEEYNIERDVWPESDADVRTAILMLEPSDARNSAALGFDMYSEERRRKAMARAIETGEISASEPVTLVQEITTDKQAGFLVYYPMTMADRGTVTAFVYAVFRAGDLHNAALASRAFPLEIETVDASAAEDALLFRSQGYAAVADESTHRVERSFTVAGRQWTMNIVSSPAFDEQVNTPFALVTGLMVLLLATAMAAATRWQLQSVDRAQSLVSLTERTVQEKDLMLQEMRHRIKNSIARILAMARQTASSSKTLEDFSQSFTARMQSMANAQDMLTRSHWEGASLRNLLETELSQIYGSAVDRLSIEGPQVMLNGEQTQALGLTFHELATNALKYGAGFNGGTTNIRWKTFRNGGKTWLDLEWRETTGQKATEPTHRGFGSRLIDANIKGELRGSIDRIYGDDGLTISIKFPL